ncbi:MAG: hypothetical protein ACK5LG_21855 [Bacteroides thetaiotaomicron]
MSDKIEIHVQVVNHPEYGEIIELSIGSSVAFLAADEAMTVAEALAEGVGYLDGLADSAQEDDNTNHSGIVH